MINSLETVSPAVLDAHWGVSDKVIGFVAASLMPAIFWMLVLSGTSSALGLDVTGQTIAMTGAAIAAFLAAVFAALTQKAAQ